ncbi:uncharacterized protein LOC119113761, partial [Pollicipes pollicipes]|uniref:uncharacterized protein LOC119113761 n=1 Tax=Pollicipes pollicipes TaxID=41117 RepID=UPI0018854A8A
MTDRRIPPCIEELAMPLRWVLLLTLVLQLGALATGAPFSRRWSAFNRRNHNFKPFQPPSARFAAPLRGFSNIFRELGDSSWGDGRMPSMARTAWSEYPVNRPRLQPLPQPRNPYYRGFPAQAQRPPIGRRHQFVPARKIQSGQVPTVFLTDAELHGLVCVPASSLSSALASHRDSQVSRSPDGSVTLHRTVLAGRDGDTAHSTRITSGADATVVETRTNSTSGVQSHRQQVVDTGAGIVRSSTGSAFSRGKLGLPSYADVLTSSTSGGGSSRSHASASGFGSDKAIPSSSTSHSASGLDSVAALSEPLPEVLPTLSRPDLSQLAPEEDASAEVAEEVKEFPEEDTEDIGENAEEDAQEDSQKDTSEDTEDGAETAQSGAEEASEELAEETAEET